MLNNIPNPIVSDDWFGYKGQLIGCEDVTALARRVKRKDGDEYFYVKKSNKTHKFFNPIHFRTYEVTEKNTDGSFVFEFSRVNAKLFEYYIKFLQSRDEVYLTYAEREEINGY